MSDHSDHVDLISPTPGIEDSPKLSAKNITLLILLAWDEPLRQMLADDLAELQRERERRPRRAPREKAS